MCDEELEQGGHKHLMCEMMEDLTFDENLVLVEQAT